MESVFNSFDWASVKTEAILVITAVVILLGSAMLPKRFGRGLSVLAFVGMYFGLVANLVWTTSSTQLLANMPKVGTEVEAPNGKGVVVYNDLLRERVSVKRQSDGDTFVVEDFDLEEISVGNKKFKRIIEKCEKKQPEPKPEREPFLSDAKEIFAKEEPQQQKGQKQKPEKPQKNNSVKKVENKQTEEPEKSGGKHFHKGHGKRHHFKPKSKSSG